MSPKIFNREDARLFYLETTGEKSSKIVSEELAVRPVIILSNKAVFTSGDGTANSPYRIGINGYTKLID